MKTHFRIMLLGMLVAFQSHAAKFFSPADQNLLKGRMASKTPKSYQLYKADLSGLYQELRNSPRENLKSTISAYGLEIALPVAGFGELKFRVADIPVMEDGAQDRFPEIKTFTGQCVEKPSFTLKMDLTPLGFHAAVFGEDDIYIIDPIELRSEVVMVYKFSDFPKSGDFSCLSSEEHHVDKGEGALNKAAVTSLGLQRRDYRLAVGTNTQFVNFYGGTQALALSALTTKINRMNGIYERDFAIRMNLVSNSLSLMGLFTVTGAPALNTIHSTIATAMGGTSNFDIGHYVGLSDVSPSACGFNGLARIGVVCNNSLKGEGFSQAGACAINDPWVDFGLIPHEVGHMFGADHTFNSDCSGNRNGGTAYEPGAGNSIMSYWFGCEHGGNDGSLHPFFHAGSWFQVSNYTTTGSTGFACPVLVNTGNAIPTANAGSNIYVPRSTPLVLNGSSTDEVADQFSLTRSWDQIDIGPVTAPNSPTGNAPLFRMREPSTSNGRFLPAFNSVLNGTSTVGETLPSYARRFRMAFLVRDNRAGNGATRLDTASYYVVNTPSAFSITSPTSATTINEGQPLTVTWNVANTNLSPISVANVSIDLSVDGGNNFFRLVFTTPNDGSETINIPAGSKTQNARIKINSNNGYFYALSQNLVIGGGLVCYPPAPISFCTAGDIFKSPVQSFRITNSGGTSTLLSNLNSGCGTFPGNSAYSDFTANTSFRPGLRKSTVYRFVATGCTDVSYCSANGYGYYLDINKDGLFSGAGEYLGGTDPAVGDIVFNWTVPSTLADGFYRLRVRSEGGRKPLAGEACNGYFTAGEAEDYLVFVSNYCAPNYTIGCNSGDFINSFTLHTYSNNNTGCSNAGQTGNFSLYTGPSLYANTSYPFTVSTGSVAQEIGIWIDFNNDFDFDDAGEFVYESPASGTSISGSITIPKGLSGVRRMRVRSTWVDASQLQFAAGDFCAVRQWGETEEYDITILSRGTVASGNQTICNGGDPNNIALSTLPSGAGPFTYQWYLAPGLVSPPALGSTTGWTLISGATASSYNPPAGLTSNTSYACLVTPAGHGAGWAASERRVTVRAVFSSGTLASGNQTFSGSGDPSSIAFATAPTGGSGTFAYRWYSANGIQPAPTGTVVPAGWTLISGASTNSYDPPSISASTSYAAMVDATGSPDCAPFTWAGGVRQITINSISFSPGVLAAGDQFICNGAGPSSILFSTAPTAGSTYQWYFRDGLVAAPANTDPIGTWQILAGQTGSFLTPGATFASRTFACRVTNGANSQWATGVRQVTVLAPFNPGTILGGDQTFCGSGDPANITMSTIPVGSGGYTWRWYFRESATGDCPSGGTVPAGWVTNNTSPNITGTTLTGSGISFDPASAGALNAGRTFAVLITPIANGSIPACGTPQWANSCRRTSVITCSGFSPGVLAAGNQTLCNPADPAAIAFSTAPTAGSTFQWYFQDGIVAAPAATAPLTGWTSISAATSNTYDPPAGLTGSRTFACRVTNGVNSQWASGVRQVTVSAVFSSGTLASGNQSFTGSGDPAAISFSAAPTGGAGTFAYRWYSRPGIHAAPTGTVVPAEWTLIGSATSATYDPPVQSASISFAAMVDPTGTPDCGPFTWAGGVRQITVSTSSFSPGVLAAGNQTICNGTAPNAISFSTLPTAGSTFQWYSQAGLIAAPANTDPIGSWTIVSGQTSNSLSPAALTGNRTYACRVTNGANSQWATGVRQVTVLPAFNPGSLIANQAGCAGYNPAPITMATNPQGSGAYNWRWYYAESSSIACLPSIPPPSPTWITNSTDTRFFGTSTTGVGINFDPSSPGAAGRTWVLLVTPVANGSIPACGTAQLATTCHRTLLNPCRFDVDGESPSIQLGQNIPNPFSDGTTIPYFIPAGTGSGQLEVVSMEGKILFTEATPEGVSGEVKIQKGKLAPGTYFYRLRTNQGYTQPMKMVVN